MSVFSVNLGLPQAPLTENPELFGELVRVYNAIKNITYAHDVVTGAKTPDRADWPQLSCSRITVGGMCRLYKLAGVDIEFGQTVAVHSSGLLVLAQSPSLKAVGFCTVRDGVSAGDYVEIQTLGMYPLYPEGTLTPGVTYYQSATPGVIGTSGSQVLGYAISDQELWFSPQF